MAEGISIQNLTTASEASGGPVKENIYGECEAKVEGDEVRRGSGRNAWRSGMHVVVTLCSALPDLKAVKAVVIPHYYIQKPVAVRCTQDLT